MNLDNCNSVHWEPEASSFLLHDLASLQFILNQAVALFEDTLEVRRNHEARNVGMLTALIPTSLAVFGAFFGVVALPNTPFLQQSIVFVLLSLSAAIVVCVASIIPSKRFRHGSLPSDLFREEWKHFTKDKRLKFYIANEIISYEKRCKRNLELTELSSKRLMLAAYLAAAAPGSLLVTIAVNAMLPEGFFPFVLWYFSHILFGLAVSNQTLSWLER